LSTTHCHFFECSRLKGGFLPISVFSPSQSWPQSRDPAEDLLISNLLWHGSASVPDGWPQRVAQLGNSFVCCQCFFVFGPTLGRSLRGPQSTIASSSLSHSQEPFLLVPHSTYVAEVQSITHSIRYLRRLSDIGSVVPPLTRSETQAVPQHGFLGTST
jgi:hypothetical protein